MDIHIRTLLKIEYSHDFQQLYDTFEHQFLEADCDDFERDTGQEKQMECMSNRWNLRKNSRSSTRQ